MFVSRHQKSKNLLRAAIKKISFEEKGQRSDSFFLFFFLLQNPQKCFLLWYPALLEWVCALGGDDNDDNDNKNDDNKNDGDNKDDDNDDNKDDDDDDDDDDDNDFDIDSHFGM